MIVKQTTQVGNPVIRQKAKKVSDVHSGATKKIIKDLTDSMRHHELVGMAAPQIGKGVRIFVTEIRETKVRKDIKHTDPLRVFINPQIVSVSTKKVNGWEGCGSVASAQLFGKMKRAASLTIKASDEQGKEFELKTEGFLARVIQHELDHLNGVVFTDNAEPQSYMSKDEYLNMKK